MLINKVVLFCMLCLANVFTVVQAQSIRMPNGLFTESVEELRVKNIGSDIVIQRTWFTDTVNQSPGRWLFNAAWASLKLEYDALDGSIIKITRNGAEFLPAGGLFVFDREYFIRPMQFENNQAGFQWYDRVGNWIDYDSAGHIIRYGDANLTQAQFVRDSSHNITQIKDANDQVALTFTYQGHLIQTIVDRAGRTLSYTWQDNRLREVRNVLGGVWKYEYDGRGNIIKRTDPENRTMILKYNDFRVVSRTDADGFITQWGYDYDRTKREYTILEYAPDNITTESRYDHKGHLLLRIVGNRTIFTRPINTDRVNVSRNERGLETRTEYDAMGNVTRVVNPDGSYKTQRFDTHNNLLESVNELQVKTVFTYDNKRNRLSMIEAAGTDHERKTTWTYDDKGQVLTQTQYATEFVRKIWMYHYDGYGNIDKITDPVGGVTRASYDMMGNRLTQTNALGLTTHYTYNDLGWLLTTTDAEGNTYSTQYDLTGKRISSTNANQQTTQYRYNQRGLLTQQINALGKESIYTYDQVGRVKTYTDASGLSTTYHYDDTGRLLRLTDQANNITQYHYGANNGKEAGLLISFKTPSYIEYYEYDKQERRTQIKREEKGEMLVEQTVYDAVGNRITTIDAAGKTTQYQYDDFNRLVAKHTPDQNTIYYKFDLFGNLINVTNIVNGNQNTRFFGYDLLNRIVFESLPQGNTIQYRYDAIGQLKTRIDTKQQSRHYIYDKAKRLVREQYVNSTGGEHTISYEYDANGNLTGYTDGQSSGRYRYDKLNRKIEDHITLDLIKKIEKTISYAYRDNGQIKSITYPNQQVLEYDYDSIGNQNKITFGSQAVNYDYQWKQLQSATFAGGLKKTYAYDEIGRIAEIQLKPATGLALQHDQYGYDRAGNIKKIDRIEGSYQYGYDVMGRLTSVNPPAATGLPTEGYVYDAAHNRISSAHQAGLFKYNANNSLMSRGTRSALIKYKYDYNSNLIEKIDQQKKQTQQYIYNGRDRLTQTIIQEKKIQADYVYDPFGRRIKKTVNQQTIYYLYNHQGLVAEYDQTGQQKVIYGWKNNSLWGTDPVLQQRGDQTYWYHNDHLGTPKLLTNGQGLVVWEARSEAFGQANITIATIENNLRFLGQYYDAETDTHYNFMRDYDPSIGRYIQIDLISLNRGINGYVSGKSVIKFDEKRDFERCVELPASPIKKLARTYFTEATANCADVNYENRAIIDAVYD